MQAKRKRPAPEKKPKKRKNEQKTKEKDRDEEHACSCTPSAVEPEMSCSAVWCWGTQKCIEWENQQGDGRNVRAHMYQSPNATQFQRRLTLPHTRERSQELIILVLTQQNQAKMTYHINIVHASLTNTDARIDLTAKSVIQNTGVNLDRMQNILTIIHNILNWDREAVCILQDHVQVTISHWNSEKYSWRISNIPDYYGSKYAFPFRIFYLISIWRYFRLFLVSDFF